MKRWNNIGLWVLIALVLTAGLVPWLNEDAAMREVIFTVILSVGLASSLNIFLGYTGYVSFGHIVYFGLGGYVSFYLIDELNVHLLISVLAGGLASATLAWLLGKAILRLRGAYFALATIGVNEAMRAFINNFKPFGGPTGMTLNFQVYKDYGGALQSLWIVFGSVVLITILVLLVSYAVKTSKFGLGLMAIRENQDAAEVMGVVTPEAKTWAYVLSALFPGMLGALFFFKNGNIEPHDAFRLHVSIEWIVMVMLGGFGTVIGPTLGATVYQRLRGYLLVTPIFKDIQLAVAGGLLLVIVLFVPAGAIGWLRNRFTKLREVLV